MFNSQQLGYFISKELWEDANKLLLAQLKAKLDNKHFNTMSMFYYDKIDPKDRDIVNTEQYYLDRIATNLFYGLQSEFKDVEYVIPKSALGLRPYHFLSYPLRLIYYAIGLYLVRITRDFRLNFIANYKHIHSFWGGNLLFCNNGRLTQPEKDNIYYWEYYDKFRKGVLQQIESNFKTKVILKLDMQNYFEEIKHDVLLEKLRETTTHSVISENKFDIYTRTQIANFLGFISNNIKGIPQLDNDILSSFLGYLYLLYADLGLDDEVKKSKDFFDEYHIFRYIDDIYISIVFKSTIKLKEREKYVSNLGTTLADYYYNNFGLRINDKTEVFYLSKKNDKKRFVESIKKISHPEYYTGSDKDKKPQDMVEEIFKVLDNLKKFRLGQSFTYLSKPEEDILKNIFEKPISQLFNSKPVKTRLTKLFKKFDFALVKLNPPTLTTIIALDPAAQNHYRRYLLEQQKLTTREAYLIVKFLCQTEFNNPTDLLKKLSSIKNWKDIVDMFDDSQINMNYPGYYELEGTKIIQLGEFPSIIEQIRLRILNEKQNRYSVALNHLLNEFQSICWEKNENKSGSFKDFDSIKVCDFLQKKDVPSNLIIQIRNMFDRRNNNQISHPSLANPVDYGEYIMFRKIVGECLNFIL